MEAFDIPGACESLRVFLDLLTNWYVRTQRDRFWGEDTDSFDTLFTVLETVTRLSAPLLPLLTEEIWRGLTGGRSVHLTDFPIAHDAWADTSVDGQLSLKDAMDQVREVVSTAHALRKKEQLRVRQPLSLLEVAVADKEAMAPFSDLVASELNVKSVAWVSVEQFIAAHPVEQRLSVNARAAGPRIGKLVQAAIKGAKTGDWQVGSVDGVGGADGVVTSGGIVLEEGEYELTTVIRGAEDAGDGASSSVAAVLQGRGNAAGGFVLLDTALTPELEAEGYARDVIRAVQDERKNVGLNVSDRIELSLTVPADRVTTARIHTDLIAGETLAQDPTSGASRVTIVAGPELAITVTKRDPR
jgi:isoleucyl-tRNA synthetase